MKKICLMGGAVVNAGDFLLEKRSYDLIRYFVPDSEITVLKRVNEDYSNKVDYLNSFNAIIFAGGPLYRPGLYRHQIPFVHQSLLNSVKAPIFFLGGGIKGSVYRISYGELDKAFLDKGVNCLSCRDIYTYRFLHHQGYKALMTGCPAWYDLDCINNVDISKFRADLFRKICVSEPANDSNLPLLIGLLKHLREKYPSSEIVLVNHREVKQELKTELDELLKRDSIGFVNIAGSVDGFSIYDNCDLHVGFRVHAHIYNLSKRNQTILFSEDIRGAGVNQTLGLENMSAEDMFYGRRKMIGDYYLIRCPEENKDTHNIAGEMFDDYLKTCSDQGFQNYNRAFQLMKDSFQTMRAFFDGINSVI